MNTLVEKVGETRTVKILDVLSEKYAKNLGERKEDNMRMISGSNFKTEDKIEMKIDKFEEMVTEVDRIENNPQGMKNGIDGSCEIDEDD